MSKEAMKLALEALELVNLEFVCANGSHHAKKDRHEWDEDCPITDRWRKAITALRQALANEALDKMAENARELGIQMQPAQQEPVAIALNTGTKQGVKWLKNVEHGEHLYTSPPAQRKPLTFSKLCDIEYEITHRDGDFSILKFARAIEAAHGIKENT